MDVLVLIFFRICKYFFEVSECVFNVYIVMFGGKFVFFVFVIFV